MCCIVVRSSSIVDPIHAGAGRAALRQRLLAERERFVASPAAAAAAAALAAQLADLLETLEPESLGVFWPVRSEFNAVAALAADRRPGGWPLALPFARRSPPGMEYRRWDGATPTLRDEVGIPACAGAVTVPDVVLVPCVGFTADAFRLGYGGGFFDRWLAAHPVATAVGIAWGVGAVTAEDFAPLPHDRPLTLVLTERGVVS